MKNLTLALGLLVFGMASVTVHAEEASLASARKVKDEISTLLFAMKGVNGVGITGCSSEGKQKTRGSEDCIEILTETAAAANALKTLLPSGTRVDGVYVVVQNIGRIVPQPRASAGNK